MYYEAHKKKNLLLNYQPALIIVFMCVGTELISQRQLSVWPVLVPKHKPLQVCVFNVVFVMNMTYLYGINSVLFTSCTS